MKKYMVFLGLAVIISFLESTQTYCQPVLSLQEPPPPVVEYIHAEAPLPKKKPRLERFYDYCHAKAEAHPKIVKGAKVAGGGLAFLLSIGSSLGNILRYKG